MLSPQRRLRSVDSLSKRPSLQWVPKGPYLGVDSTVLTCKWRGQLAYAIGIDGHNWMFPVAYCVFYTETKENWEWFISCLHKAIGSPQGLVISTDAGKGIDDAVTKVFTNGVEHRECMRHLYKNFQRRFHGEVFERNLWPASRAYKRDVFEKHYNIMKQSYPRSMQWIEENHQHLWARCMFSTFCKCDYVTNNIVETFNSWIRHEKSLPVVELMDKIMQMIMERMCTRSRLAMKLKGKILENVMKNLRANSRNLNYKIHKGRPFIEEVGGVNKDLSTWRHIVDLNKHECSCMEWQLTGPCRHAIWYIGSLREIELEDFVHKYYSMDMFKATYASWVVPLPDKSQWEKVDLGFKLWPPLLKRAAGRPRSRRIVGVEEGGSGTKRRRCKRCLGFGHLQKTCNEPIFDPDAPPPAPEKPKRVRKKKTKHVEVTDSSSTAAQPLAIEGINNSPGPMTRRQKALLESTSPAASPGKKKKRKISKKL